MDGKRTLEDIIHATDQRDEALKAYKKAMEAHMKTNMFKPKTGRAPKDRTTTSENIFTHLINAGQVYERKKLKDRK